MAYQPDFIERNGTWILSMVGAVGGTLGGLCAYMVKSRCSRIRFCGIDCEREPLPLEPDAVAVEMGEGMPAVPEPRN